MRNPNEVYPQLRHPVPPSWLERGDVRFIIYEVRLTTGEHYTEHYVADAACSTLRIADEVLSQLRDYYKERLEKAVILDIFSHDD